MLSLSLTIVAFNSIDSPKLNDNIYNEILIFDQILNFYLVLNIQSFLKHKIKIFKN
jgi:hypothetical protein